MRDCAKTPAIWSLFRSCLPPQKGGPRGCPRGLDQIQTQSALRETHAEELLRSRRWNCRRRSIIRARCPRTQQIRRFKQRAEGPRNYQRPGGGGEVRGERWRHIAIVEDLRLSQRVVVDTHVIDFASEVSAKVGATSVPRANHQVRWGGQRKRRGAGVCGPQRTINIQIAGEVRPIPNAGIVVPLAVIDATRRLEVIDATGSAHRECRVRPCVIWADLPPSSIIAGFGDPRIPSARHAFSPEHDRHSCLEAAIECINQITKISAARVGDYEAVIIKVERLPSSVGRQVIREP